MFMASPRRDRLIVGFLIATAVAVLLVRLGSLQGLISVVRIEGGSMAESLLGEHVELICSECSRRWLCDRLQYEQTSLVACPNCGQRVDDATRTEKHPGTRAVIDRAAYWLQSPQRFDVVAFHPPDSPQLAVKRIIALPGETLEIRRGELFVNGQLLRKSFRQFRETAVLVSEQHRETTSAWKQQGDELAYHHHPAHPAARNQTSPVQDFDAYNPAIARELNAVADVIAQCRFSAAGAVLGLRVHDGYDWFTIHYDATSGKVVAEGPRGEIASAESPALLAGEHTLAWGVFDRQLVLAIDDRMMLHHELAETARPLEPVPTPLAIARGIEQLEVHSLRVFRDIYHLDEHHRGGCWKGPSLGAGEYVVLGDNPPLSIDSRHWEPGVRRREILGKVQPR